MNGLTMNQAIRSVSLACELVHAATLLHDDDWTKDRTPWPDNCASSSETPPAFSVATIPVNALRRVNLSTNVEITQTLLDCIAVMVEAEAIQLDRRGVFEPSREVYHEVIYGKTASIFEWGMASGAVLADAPSEISDAMGTVGRKLVWLSRWSTIFWTSPPMQRPSVRMSGQI